MTDTAKTWTVNSIKDAVRAAGSHWFDPDNMRFFGTRILPTVYQGPGGVYFVTSEQPPHGQRKYSVRSFDAATAGIDTVGEFAAMTRGQAVALAHNKAVAGSVDANATETTEDYKPVTILDEFLADLHTHSSAPAKVTAKDATAMIASAARHHRLMEQLCSDEAFCREVDAEGNHPQVTDCRERCERIARRLGAAAVIFSGDPRGCTVKVTFRDGFTNDFAKEGYCVPTSLTEDD